MKQRILIAAACVLLAALILLILPGPADPPLPNPTTGPTASSTVTGPARPQPTTRPIIVVPPEPGVVTLYTCDVELYTIYLELATEYMLLTGNKVEVLAPGGDSCEETLAQYMESDHIPTVFCIHNQQAAESWSDSLYDLTGSALAEGLLHEAFALTRGDRIVAVGVDVEGLGLIYNASLLGISGYSRTDFTEFASFESGVEHITDYKGEQGFYAFGKMDFSDAEHDGLACLLSLLYSDPDELRSFVDLYRRSAAKSGDALDSFLQGKSVFYLGGSRDYEKLAGITSGTNNLDILPAYSAGGGTLQYVCDHYWALNGQVSEQDLEASLWFMHWLVTASGSNPAPVDRLGLLSPYKDATHYNNILERKLREYMTTEAVSVVWERCANVAQQDLQALSDAMAAYVAAPSDETWASVATLLIKNQKMADTL